LNDALLETLADKGDGHYAYVDSLDEARKLFVDDLTSTLQVIAMDAKIQVAQPRVVALPLIGYEARWPTALHNDAVDAGEMGAGHPDRAVRAVHPAAMGVAPFCHAGKTTDTWC
jgi:Ca-activated chloride channel family protein